MRGFTLVEILISIVIFMFILLALEALLSSIFATEFRAFAMKKLTDNSGIALEIMSREMRLAAGDATGCTTSGQAFEIDDNPSVMQGTKITFIDFSDRCISYIYDSTTDLLLKQVDGTASQIFLGGGDIEVSDALFFKVAGVNQQPRIITRVEVRTQDPSSSDSFFALAVQTTISQRELNIE
jgi:type II secretory pathway pseudopilin PulG